MKVHDASLGALRPTPRPAPTGPKAAPATADSNQARGRADTVSLTGAPAVAPPPELPATAGADVASRAADLESTSPRTIEGLLEAWGGKSGRYDLDRDGVVAMSDLLRLLASQNPGEPPRTNEHADVASRAADLESTSPRTIEGLLEAWGGKSGRYDLDRDGVVAMSDLLRLLASQNPGEPPRTNEHADVASRAADLESTSPRTIEGLLEAWGGKSGRYDLDRDGVVAMGDLLQLLAAQNDEAEPSPAASLAESAPAARNVRTVREARLQARPAASSGHAHTSPRGGALHDFLAGLDHSGPRPAAPGQFVPPGSAGRSVDLKG